ncbi:MAG TPA: hypothetical protein VFU81_16290 [Thermomicrobiales bacterium]|nr:hypothetical protein [Thermomicrobiales bacterium]
MRHRAATNPIVRSIAIAMLVVGLVLTVGSLFADNLNLTGGGVGLGWKQLIGLIVGLALFLGGAAWLVMPPGRSGSPR